jgi:anti-sigma factor RsiW
MIDCEYLVPLVEPIAAGDLAPDARVAAHLAACPRCGASLELARRIEQAMKARVAPQAPPQFTSHALARIRRDRWQREQWLDAGFNAAVILLGVGITAAAVLIFYTTGFDAIGNALIELVASAAAQLARQVAPSLPLYGAATALVATALGIWWWTERDMSV